MRLCTFLAMLLSAFGSAAAGDKPVPPSPAKAEMMGRVEWVMMHGGRDITARKSIEWGNVEKHENGNRSIRYKYHATIRNKDTKVMHQLFTFDPGGIFVSVTNAQEGTRRQGDR